MTFTKLALIALTAATINVAQPTTADAGQWVKCTHEGGHCKDVKNGDLVRYAAGGVNAPHKERRVGGSFWCTNAVFGDPKLGRKKYCYVYKKTWVKCTHEGGHCKDVGRGDLVRYAAGGPGSAHKQRTMNGPFWCTNAVFGDPKLGRKKYCYVLK